MNPHYSIERSGALRALALFSTLVLLTGCGAGNSSTSAEYMLSSYGDSEPGQSVTVDSPEGPQTLKVRLHQSGTKAIVLLESGVISRALAKDFGAKDNALPVSVFEAALQKRLDQNCRITVPIKRQDYLWEFQYDCRGTQIPTTRADR